MRRKISYEWIVPVLLLGLVACTSSTTSDPPVLDTLPVPAASESSTSTSTPDGSSPETPSATPASDLPNDPTEFMRATYFGNLTDITRKMVDNGNQSYIPFLLEFMRIDRNPEGRFAWASSINRLVEGPDADQTPPEQTDWGWWI